MTYVLQNEWELAHERLRLLAEILDPDTYALLQSVGVQPGWSCLELGAGIGSVTRWLSKRVGSTGRVVALDLDIRWVDCAQFDHVCVVEKDVRELQSLEETFDLVYARNMLVHVPERVAVIQDIADALAPDGWLVVEEPDLATMEVTPTNGEDMQGPCAHVIAAIHHVMEQRGVSLRVSGELRDAMHEAGLHDITAEQRIMHIRGATGKARFFQLTYQQMRDAVLASGAVSEDAYDRFLRCFDDARFVLQAPTITSIRGRRRSSTQTR